MTESDHVQATIGELHTKPTDKKNGRRRVHVLTQSFTVSVKYPGGTDKITVPAGFETDFASIPVLFSPILGPRDDYAELAVVHDWLCKIPGLPSWYVDSKMRTIMAIRKQPYWKRLVIFWGLRYFGWSSPPYRLMRRILERLGLKDAVDRIQDM